MNPVLWGSKKTKKQQVQIWNKSSFLRGKCRVWVFHTWKYGREGIWLDENCGSLKTQRQKQMRILQLEQLQTIPCNTCNTKTCTTQGWEQLHTLSADCVWTITQNCRAACILVGEENKLLKKDEEEEEEESNSDLFINESSTISGYKSFAELQNSPGTKAITEIMAWESNHKMSAGAKLIILSH